MTVPNIYQLYFHQLTASTFVYSISGITNTVAFDDAIYPFTRFRFKTASFNEKRLSDSTGTYYSKQFDIRIQDINSDKLEALEGKELIASFTDANRNTFISEYDKPFIFAKHDANINNEKNIIE